MYINKKKKKKKNSTKVTIYLLLDMFEKWAFKQYKITVKERFLNCPFHGQVILAYVTGVLQVTIDLPRNHPLYVFPQKGAHFIELKLQ